MVESFKNLLLQNQKSYDLDTWHVALGTQALQSFINDDPGLTLTFFTCFCNYSRPRYQVSVLESVPSAKYQGVTISEDLKWTDHINDISKKANQTLVFLKRNIRVHNNYLKSTAFKTLVRPQLEYASTVWSPYTDQDINKLESVQRRAARWVTRDNRYTSSVSSGSQLAYP